MKIILKFLTILSLLFTVNNDALQAQEVNKTSRKKERSAAIGKLVEGRNFTFEARTITPAGGGTRQLNSYYDLAIKGDTIISFLPYFGRAYSPPISTADAGIRFTSNEFSYDVTPGRKGGWNVVIKPQHVTTAQQLNLRVFENGQATLQVISNNRQPISFMGTIKENRNT